MEGGYTGELTQEASGGKVTIAFVNGRKHGTTRFVADNGNVVSEIQYVNDLIHGEVRQFYASGKPMSIMTYVNGSQSGPFISFSENGMKQIESNYEDGKLHGTSTTFDEFGDVAAESTYVHGAKSGRSSLYYPKSRGGYIYELSFYKDGLLEEDRVVFYPTGEVMSVTKYKAGKAQTYPQNFDKAGNPVGYM
ncbi:MAG: toxin-antitoxin system YwqK family antitoxin [Holosporales bacterium]|nr:toxin-antitoxin system YwqK family antitoxin [Holosporales bacterium]